MKMGRRHFVLMLSVAGGVARADLDAVMAESKLERRFRKAIENANKMLDAARAAYLKGETETVNTALQEVEDSVKLAYQSLKDTGRKPRKASKHYKRAEIGARKLLRRLDTFRNEMSYLDREKIEAVMKKVEEVQDNLLNDVMGGGR